MRIDELYSSGTLIFVQKKNMLTREFVLEQIKQMPERFTIDEIMEKLFFLYKIEIALEQSKADQVIPHEQIKEKYRKWLQ